MSLNEIYSIIIDQISFGNCSAGDKTITTSKS